MKRLLVGGVGVLCLVLVQTLPTSAATKTFEVSGWLPYWRASSSTKDVMPHLDLLTEINPFVYTLKNDGTLADNGTLDEEPWKSLIAEAQKKGVRVIPTVMTGSGDLLHKLLRDQTQRIALEDRIADLVKEKGFDGIDIDFEGKHADEKEYFATFLKGLYARMGNKWVMCSIESRTPLDSRYHGFEIPADATIYANDFVAINKYCDRVRIMAYDQQGIDQQLLSQADSSARLYAPVADPVWVKKVVELAAKQISRDKIVIGVPTYGYEYKVTAYAGGQYLYKILWTFNPGYAWPIAQQYGITPERNTAGELYFTYTPDAPVQGRSGLSANLAAEAASTYANAYNSNLSFNLMDWPDAASIAQKVALAKELGVRGVAIFKLDGGEDQNIWNVLQGVAGSPLTAPIASAPSSAVTGAALTRGLDIGSTGSDVRTLQKILNVDADTKIADSGPGSPGNETAYFGPATASAVKKFQLKYGLTTAGSSGYGYVGPKTRAKLNEVLLSL